VEVTAMLYRDELEEGGMDKEDVDAAVAERRAELMVEAERDLEKLAASRGAGDSNGAGKADRDRSGRSATLAL
jgi:hypothetical protein